MNPIYSICIPNLNMADTIETALRSVLNQIDSRFEVVVVDDGSNDGSVEILRKLSKEFSILNVIELSRNRKRTLAETRNISVRHSRGEYLILHIDCDDYWHPHITDFVKIYHLIEKEVGSEFLMSGFQFHMGHSAFLKKHGPYKFGHMVEDRDLWYRMASQDCWIPLDHVVFRERMRLSMKKRLSKYFLLTIRIVSDEIRQGRSFRNYLHAFKDKELNHSFKYKCYKCIIYPVALMRARLLGNLPDLDSENWNDIKAKAWNKSGTIVEFFAKRGKAVDLSELSIQSQWIFSHSSKQFKYNEMPK